jgi:hypothetical protein
MQSKVEKLALEKFNINSLVDVAIWTTAIRKKEKNKNSCNALILQKNGGLMTL